MNKKMKSKYTRSHNMSDKQQAKKVKAKII